MSYTCTMLRGEDGLHWVAQASYEDVLINGPFAGDEKPLRALEQAGIVAVVHRDSRHKLEPRFRLSS